jgi:hypothetical protein
MGSSSSNVSVYVRLLGEGTNVFRPTLGSPVAGSHVRLLATPDYDEEDEDWEFKPGSVVLVQRRRLEGREVDVAVALIE